MKHILLVALFATLVGCASTSDIENLQSQVDGLKTSITQASADAQSAQLAAVAAATKADAATAAANIAAQYAQDANSKLDNLFKKAMYK